MEFGFYMPNFVSFGLFCRPLAAKTPNFAVFGLRHFVMMPVHGNVRKLNTGAQLQTFPYTTVPKTFLYSNNFMAKSYAETPSLKSVKDEQTNQQTNKKLNIFGRPGGG